MYSKEEKSAWIEKILAGVESGKGLNTICVELNFPRKTFERWLEGDEELCARYARAKTLRADLLFEEILSISDAPPERVLQLGSNGEGGTERIDPAYVTWQKQRVDARKWALSKMLPKKYGDRVELEHSGEVKRGGGIDFSKLSIEELEAFRKLRSKVSQDVDSHS